jgi:predicted AAA+ superfamily ATPase
MRVKPRDNPFRSEIIDNIPFRFHDTNIDELMDRLSEMNYRAEITGPHGAGKTILHETIESRLKANGLSVITLRLHAEGDNNRLAARLSKDARTDDIIMLDGADHISPRAWKRFLKATQDAPGLIITTHTQGMLPTLISCHTTPALQYRIVTTLTGKDTPDLRTLSNTLYKKYSGNIRFALRDLYDRWGT